MKRDLIIFLILQIFAVIWAGLSFSLFSSRLVAGALAGGFFLALGLYILWRISKWPRPWRSFTVYPALAHVFVISIPMLLTRFLQASHGFETLTILGIPAPAFHRLSTLVFAVMIIATITDLARHKFLRRH